MADWDRADIRTRARVKADQENSTFVSDATLNGWINEAIAELHGLLLQAFGEDYFEKDHTFNTVANQEEYDLPSDFAKLAGFSMKLDGSKWTPITRYEKKDRDGLENLGSQSTGFRYRLRARKLSILPKPSGVFACRMPYEPTAVVLAADGDVLTGYKGWEEFVVIRAAIECIDKEESDSSAKRADLARIISRIESEKERRDENEPSRIIDVEGRVGVELEDLEGFW